MSQVETFALDSLSTETSGLRVDNEGVVRIGNSRVTLDLIVEQYEIGMAPEDMVRAYDTLDLADVHAAIAFYLRHRGEVAAYIECRKNEATALREKLEQGRAPFSREQLLARCKATEVVDAPPGK